MSGEGPEGLSWSHGSQPGGEVGKKDKAAPDSPPARFPSAPRPPLAGGLRLALPWPGVEEGPNGLFMELSPLLGTGTA